jgi:hypothetical protein
MAVISKTPNSSPFILRFLAPLRSTEVITTAPQPHHPGIGKPIFSDFHLRTCGGCQSSQAV